MKLTKPSARAGQFTNGRVEQGRRTAHVAIVGKVDSKVEKVEAVGDNLRRVSHGQLGCATYLVDEARESVGVDSVRDVLNHERRSLLLPCLSSASLSPLPVGRTLLDPVQAQDVPERNLVLAVDAVSLLVPIALLLRLVGTGTRDGLGRGARRPLAGGTGEEARRLGKRELCEIDGIDLVRSAKRGEGSRGSVHGDGGGLGFGFGRLRKVSRASSFKDRGSHAYLERRTRGAQCS